MSADDSPVTVPRQDFTPDEIIRAAQGVLTPGLNDHRSAINRRLYLAAPAKQTWPPFCEAQRRGYVTADNTTLPELSRLWRAWCRVHGLAFVAVRTSRRADGAGVELAVGTAGVLLTPTALIPIGQAFRRAGLGAAAIDRWYISPHGGFVNDLTEPAAHALAAAFVEIARDPRCVVLEPPPSVNPDLERSVILAKKYRATPPAH